MSALERLATMPAWPLLMDALTAGLYLEVSADTFLSIVRRAGLRPVDLGVGVVRWRRRDIDDLVQGLPARGGEAGHVQAPVDFQAALERAAGRSKRGRKSS